MAATALLGALIAPGLTAAAAEPSHFSLLLRVQPELVHVDGAFADARGRNGWQLTDGWGGGSRNSHNWGALFIDGGVPLGERTRLIARVGLNIDMQGLKDGDARKRERQAGLDGPWGRLLVGRLETPYKLAGLGWDPLNATSLQARANTGRSGGAFGHGGYVDNAISYSHRLGRLRYMLFAAIDDGSRPSDLGDPDRRVLSFSLSAPIGPVEVILAHIDASRFRDGPDRRTGSKLGLRWSAGAWALAGHHEWRGRGFENGNFLFLNASYRIDDRWSLMANLGRFNHSANANDADYLALGARFAIDRRLSLHGGWRRVDRDNGGKENIAGFGARISFDSGSLLARER